MTETTAVSGGAWRDLLGARYLGTSTVLAGGVALYATNEFLTISLMPSAVAEIGGERFYAWVTTVYLVASVIAATTVHPVLMRLGPRRAYLSALAVFGLGSLGCALAPSMELLLVGRAVQGAAGGLLAGLGYAVINTALPRQLWTRASALVSAMWGVGTIVGPASGGLFAQFGSWRWAFGVLTILTAAMAVLVPIALVARNPTADRPARLRIPLASLLLLGSAALMVSVAGIPSDVRFTAGLLGVAIAIVVVFVFVDRRASVAVFPPTTFRPGPLKWIYVTLGLLMAATMVDMYVPLFGQRLAGLAPVLAGFFGAVLSVGWTAGEITSASLRRRRIIVRTVTIAPLVMAVGLGIGLLAMRDEMSLPWVIVWAGGLVLAGAGIGMAWPHLSAWAMSRVRDPEEGPAAAAAINTVQLICGAFGAGLAGVVVNQAGGGGEAQAARLLFGVFAVLAAIGVIASSRAASGADQTQSGSSSS
ncbi:MULTISPECIES: MFS transporter [Mycobacteriaceae]|uniref:MFS transporter n=1 Tax=Mycobacteriaceae TaxID=1762 RepID=UPI0007FBF44A|nr:MULTISPECIES: MFS transporter [Mycobacteriaceae]MCK0173292.1 MFS transporter [Mycolicibacterium sp. F2034L]OBB62288.1 MFS transporter [Mycobacterium sp. 852013-51886_SCH5428379]